MGMKLIKSTSFALAALLSGCAVLIPEPAPSLYDLVLDENVYNVSGRTSSQILIANPKVVSSLDNDRIVIKPGPSEISYFSGVRWSDRLPRLVQLYLSRAIAATNGARAVALPGDGLLIDHQLVIDVQAFQVEVKGAQATARVSLNVLILNDKNGRVVAQSSFSREKKTRDDAVSAVNNLNQVLDKVSLDLIEWVYRKI